MNMTVRTHLITPYSYRKILTHSSPAILTPKILLVPYSPHHVPTYHTWMQSPELQLLTASEPLTLDEEYAMQFSWRQDADKLTFILCTAPTRTDIEEITPEQDDAPGMMLGDVNLFIYQDDDDEGDAEEENEEESVRKTTQTSKKPKPNLIGELEIMIAPPSHRGKGYAKAALHAFLWYISSSLPDILAEYAASSDRTGGREENRLKYLRVKIGQENLRSIRLFEGVGFVRTGVVANYFGEVELRLGSMEEWIGEGIEMRKLRYGRV